jgi:transmembrane sensor
MSSTPHPPRTKSRQEASLWLERLERGLKGSEGAGLREWLKTPENRKTIVETARLWHGPEIMSVLTQLFPMTPELQEPKRSKRRPVVVSLTVAVAIVAGTFGAFMLITGGQTPWAFAERARLAALSNPSGVYRTAIGDTREISLVDNTRITLNTGSMVTYEYTTRYREVNLVRGEAIFNVAPDADRPFYVNAGRRRFEAVGTTFNVRVVNKENVELTVTEGEVKVLYAPPRMPEEAARRRDTILYGETTVGALQAAQVAPWFQSVNRLEPSEAEARLAWMQGMIVFDNKELPDVLAEVDRYTNTRFVLADDRLRTLRVQGRFRTGDIDGLLRALREKFLVDSRRDAQGRIVLTAIR